MSYRAWLPPLVLLGLTACAAGPDRTPAASTAGEARQAPAVLVGPVTREQVERAVPEWVKAAGEASPDAEAARALAAVEPGAELTVFLGTWCGDSRRELSRFWQALDAAGADAPFPIRYIGVDELKKEPAAPVTNYEILYVPTFIVSRNGQEVGRIVESSPGGIEKDLLALLTGRARGLITARTDLQAEPSPHP